MKLLITSFAFVCSQVLSGCSERPASASTPAKVEALATAVAAAPATVASKARLARDIPANIAGSPFELGGKCAVDVFNHPGQLEITTIERAAGLTITGWAFDDATSTVPAAPVLQLVNGEDRYYAMLERVGHRDDLSKTFDNPLFSQAGYTGAIEIVGLPAAQYDVLIIQKAVAKNLVCPTYRKLAIKG